MPLPLCAAEAHLHVGDSDCVIVVRKGGEVNLKAAVPMVGALVLTIVEAVHLWLASMAANNLSLIRSSVLV